MVGGASPRRRGDYFEYQARDFLISLGYIVGRSAGSRGSFDLVGLKAGRRPLLITCKVSGKLPSDERNRLLAAAEKAGATPMLAYRPQPGKVHFAKIVVIRSNTELPDFDDAGISLK